MTERQTNTKIITPQGKAIYPRLHEPDRRFNPEGDYKATVRLKRGDPTVDAFIEKLQTEYDEWLAAETKALKKGAKLKPVDPPWKDVLDDLGVKTGEVDVRFGLKARVTPKDGQAYEQHPHVFDAQRKPIGNSVRVGGGSLIRIAGSVFKWHTALGCGLSLRLKAVQVLGLVAPGFDAASYGFQEEDGWTDEAGHGAEDVPAAQGEAPAKDAPTGEGEDY